MTDMRRWIDSVATVGEAFQPSIGDGVFLEWGTDWLVETEIVDINEHEITLLADDAVMRFVSIVYEAEYHGRKVPLGKPMRGDVKKFKVCERSQDWQHQEGQLR